MEFTKTRRSSIKLCSIATTEYHTQILISEGIFAIVFELMLPIGLITSVNMRMSPSIKVLHLIMMKLVAVVAILRVFVLAYFWRNVPEFNLGMIQFLLLISVILQHVIGNKLLVTKYEDLNKIHGYRLVSRVNGLFIYGGLMFAERYCEINMHWKDFQIIINILRIIYFLIFIGNIWNKWYGRIFQLRSRTERDWEKDFPKKYVYPPLDLARIKELNRKGLRLLVYNLFVVDVTTVENIHPGALLLIEMNLMNNIALQFQGYYKFEGISTPHSNQGYALMKKMIIGRINNECKLQIPFNHLQRNETHQSFRKVDSERVSSNVYKIILRSNKFYYYATLDPAYLGGFIFDVWVLLIL